MTKKYFIRPLFWISVIFFVSVFTLMVGETPFSEVWQGTLQRLNGLSTEWNPLLDERLPRLIVLLCTGASLAVSGAVMQALFQNPLASPSVLGISCGGVFFVILALTFECHLTYPFAISLASFAGCLFSLLLVYTLSRLKGHIEINTLILTGIAISTLLMTMQGIIMYMLRDQWHLVQSLTEWQAGSTLDRNWKHVHMQLPLTIVGLFGCCFYSKELNILSLGEEEAKNLGVDVEKVRWRLFLCVSLLTGGAIAALGIIAFFGLILPHVLRRLTGPNNAKLIPMCILSGGAAMSIIDLSLRISGVRAISIGSISAFLGGIFFLFLLIGSPENEGEVC